VNDSLRNPLWWAGIGLAVAVSYAAGHVAVWFGESVLGFAKSPVSDIMMAIILGMIVANTIKLPQGLGGGLRFCSSTILRVGIMLLGIRLSLLGAGRFTLVALPFVVVAIAIGLTVVGLLGRYMKLSRQMSGLIAVGTSICGATAIVATAPLIKANESEVTYSIACITIFGLAAMFFYPILGHYLFANDPALAGLFLGTSIHETAQVAGAGLMYEAQYDAPVALDIATVTKLVRNLCSRLSASCTGLIAVANQQRVRSRGGSSFRGSSSALRSCRRCEPLAILVIALLEFSNPPTGARWSSLPATLQRPAYCWRWPLLD
jgi:uncharacterized integral membrane protein (TIGR00698 family)